MRMTRIPLQCPPVLGSCTPKWLPIYAHIRLFDNYQMKWPNVISPSDLGIVDLYLDGSEATLLVLNLFFYPLLKTRQGWNISFSFFY